jgi:hypothetical protein
MIAEAATRRGTTAARCDRSHFGYYMEQRKPFPMNRYARAAIAVLVGALIVEIGNAVGGTPGGLITLLGGVVMLCAIVEVFRKRI